MLKIGITGGIGSGKTTICNVWESLGACIINADEVARQIMVDDQTVREEIIAAFGSSAYHPDGSLNRAYVAREAFRNGRVKELNAIVHPRLPAKVERLMDEAQKHQTETVVYEAALLLQKLRPENLDVIVLVLADEKERIKRVQQRDEKDRKSVVERMDKQQNFEQLTHRADVVIHNDGSLEELKQEAVNWYQKLSTAKKD